jgi:SSS family solute:Na+ symporter
MTKKVPALAAKIAILSGVILYSISQFILKPHFGDENYPHFLHIMAILFLFNVMIMLLIGKLSPMEFEYKQQYTQQVDIVSWKYTKVIGIIICLIVIGTYIYFQ